MHCNNGRWGVIVAARHPSYVETASTASSWHRKLNILTLKAAATSTPTLKHFLRPRSVIKHCHFGCAKVVWGGLPKFTNFYTPKSTSLRYTNRLARPISWPNRWFDSVLPATDPEKEALRAIRMKMSFPSYSSYKFYFHYFLQRPINIWTYPRDWTINGDNLLSIRVQRTTRNDTTRSSLPRTPPTGWQKRRREKNENLACRLPDSI